MPDKKANAQEIYFRELPGWGHVAIVATPTRDRLGRRRYRGEVIVERRHVDRRIGHTPPVVVRAEAVSHEALLKALFPIVSSTSEIARACLVAASMADRIPGLANRALPGSGPEPGRAERERDRVAP